MSFKVQTIQNYANYSNKIFYPPLIYCKLVKDFDRKFFKIVMILM